MRSCIVNQLPFDVVLSFAPLLPEAAVLDVIFQAAQLIEIRDPAFSDSAGDELG
jgi:hypothetical protein